MRGQGMRWSKLKKQLEDFTCPSLKGRVKFGMTRYRQAHDQAGRAYITVDGKDVVNMGTLNKQIAVLRAEKELSENEELRIAQEDIAHGAAYQLLRNAGFSEETLLEIAKKRKISDLAREQVEKREIFSEHDFLEAAEQFLNSPIEESLASDNPIVKALAIIDRRVGKRTLNMLRESIKDESELVQYFYQLRCEAERI